MKQYENSLRLKVTHVRRVLSTHLQRRRSAAQSVMPDASSPSIAKSLLPVLHKLKWCIRCDKFARMVRATTTSMDGVSIVNAGILGRWGENERIRLAICPGIRKIVRHYEDLGRKSE